MFGQYIRVGSRQGLFDYGPSKGFTYTGRFDKTQNQSVINLDSSGIRTHTPIIRALQGKYGLSSCVTSSHGVCLSSWFAVVLLLLNPTSVIPVRFI